MFWLISQIVKSPIFSVISFAAIIYLIYAGNFISNLSVCSPYIAGNIQTPNNSPESPISDVQVQSNDTTIPLVTTLEKTEENSRPILLTKQAENEEEKEESNTPDPLIPPPKLTVGKRIEWFREKLPELDVLKSEDSGQKFHGRVLEFFDKNCTNRFFMVWFSPARTFGPREFLAVDTLMKANPQGCLMILSRSLDTGRGYRILKPLLDRGFKIVAVTPDVPFIVKNTPAEVWLDDMKSGNKDPGSFPLYNNLSNLIRLAILYRYGGVYLDTDFIVMRNFTGLRNAVGVQVIDKATQNWTEVNNALMIFDIGHPVLVEFLKEFATTFDGNIWGHNGPNMLSRVIQRLDVGVTAAYNLTILPIKAFYAVDWIQIPRLYKNPKTTEESKWVEDTVAELNRESYALHLWNRITRALVIEEGSVIERLIQSHCFIFQGKYNYS